MTPFLPMCKVFTYDLSLLSPLMSMDRECVTMNTVHLNVDNISKLLTNKRSSVHVSIYIQTSV